MNPAVPPPSQDLPKATPSKSNPARLLYAAAAAVLFVITLLGFQQFYLHGRAYPGHELPPPVKLLIIAHGLAMTGWVVLFLVQTFLIVGGNRRVHMALGRIGAFLAVGMVLLGLRLPIETTRFEPDVTLWGLDRRHFMAIPMLSILLFGAFVAVGIWHRRRPEVHRPMMLMAALSIIGAASDRVTGLPGLWAASVWGGLFGPFFSAVVIGAVVFIAKWALTRSFDRWYATGHLAMVAVFAFTMKLAFSRPWDQFTAFLVR